MPAIFDIVMVLSVLSLVFMMGRWSVNLKWNTTASEQAGPPPADSEMAVTEFEIIEGLSPFGLPEATLLTLRQRITTVAQLKLAINTIRTDSCRHAQEQMLPLAKEYVASSGANTEHADEMVKAIILGQISTSNGPIHPAFVSIAGQLGSIGPELWRNLNTALLEQISRELEAKIQEGPWVNASFNPKGTNTTTSSQDVVEPTKSGMLRIVRLTYNSDRVHRTPICEFDPCRTEAERVFWAQVAAANIDSYVTVDKGLSGRCNADLLTWSKFTAELEAKKPAEPVALVTAADTAAVPFTEAVEEEVPVTLDSKSAR